ncbi:MAG: DUF1385 domain-containing protein [Chloroflexi bacterium]|nr:DUF1385 domain-containing protein [Chloroflexota bacterium]
MIRGRNNAAIAVRRPNGEIAVRIERIDSRGYGRLRGIPFLRGLIILWEALSLGIRSLLYSANVALEEEEVQLTGAKAWVTMAPALIFALAVFFVLPLLLVTWLDRHMQSAIVSNLVEGVVRLAVFLLYLKVISLMRDIQRVFAYHGAEHMAIHTYENRWPLEVASARSFSTAHPRCGTAFLLIVMVVAIVVFALLGQPTLWLRIISRIVLVPVIAGISYELMRLTAAHVANPVARLISAPGMALQAMTTRPPDDSQIEVALTALRESLVADGALPQEQAAQT